MLHFYDFANFVLPRWVKKLLMKMLGRYFFGGKSLIPVKQRAEMQFW